MEQLLQWAGDEVAVSGRAAVMNEEERVETHRAVHRFAPANPNPSPNPKPKPNPNQVRTSSGSERAHTPALSAAAEPKEPMSAAR